MKCLLCFFKQKTAYEVRISDWSSDVCSSDLAEIAPTAIRFDPAQGLFGLAIVERSGFLATAENRAVLAGALDREAIVALVRTGWPTTDRILPEAIDLATPPNLPGWSIGTLDERRARARSVVAAWESAHDAPLRLRIALPDGPGATLLFGGITASLAAIGVETERVPMRADADLRLVDEIGRAPV